MSFLSMNSVIPFAMDMIKRSPNMAKNPNAQSMIDTIQNGDSTKGEQIANNILATYGLTKEQALEDISKRLGIRF